MIFWAVNKALSFGNKILEALHDEDRISGNLATQQDGNQPHDSTTVALPLHRYSSSGAGLELPFTAYVRTCMNAHRSVLAYKLSDYMRRYKSYIHISVRLAS